MPHSLDETATQLLAALRRGLPTTPRPYADLGTRAGLTESATILALRGLKESRTLRRLGAVFSPGALGYHAALGAFAVDEERVEDVAALLGGLPNVTHVFEIEDRYRLWFTLVVPSRTRLEIAESEIARSAGVADRYRVLPDELHKITASFDVEGAPEPSAALQCSTESGCEATPVRLDRDEKALVRLLQGEIPLAERPFSELAHTLSECGYDVDERWALDRIRAFVSSGAVAGVGATIRTREEPWRAALAVWRCPSDPKEAGAVISSFPEVLHCFERRVPGMGTTLIAVLEAEHRGGFDRAIERIGAAGKLETPRIAYPVREYARSGMRYFTDGD